MKKVTGLFIMVTLAFTGVMGISFFVKEQSSEQMAFSKLKTKLQKTLVLMEETSQETSPKPAVKIQKQIESKAKVHKSTTTFDTRKKAALQSMNKAFSSLLSVRHIFRHEITEMIDIIKNAKSLDGSSRKMLYAKNWSKYVKNNIEKFNMNEQSRSLVKNMISQMNNFIVNIDKQDVTKVTRKTFKVPKAPMAVDISSFNKSSDVQTRLMRKSVTESLSAIKNLESVKRSTNSLNDWLTYAWLIACALFTMIGLWMSKPRAIETAEAQVLEVISTDVDNGIAEVSETQILEFSELPELPVVEEKNLSIPSIPQSTIESFEQEDEITNYSFDLSTLDLENLGDEFNNEVEESFLFEDIINNLSTLCQAKGVRVSTANVESIEDKIEKFDLNNVGNEIEGFIKTVIRSLGRDSEKEIKIHLKDADKKVKIIAAVSGDSSFDINMKNIASGFRELEEKLAIRKGVFNIDQGILGNDINFVMQVAAEQVKSEDENVEKTKNDQGGSLTV